MSLFDRIFGGAETSFKEPDIRFGRYSDSYKTPAKYKAWDESLLAYEDERYLDSYRLFFDYLRDEREDNVHLNEKGGQITFEIYQGSKKISGFATANKLRAQARVAHTEALDVSFLRRLIERNYQLKYTRFALDEHDNLTMVFDTYTLDGSPYKLYYALKEMATNADKQDDLLLDEFVGLEAVDTSHLEPLEETEKQAKYAFLQTEIKRVLGKIEHGTLSPNKYPGAMTYLLLDLIYRLDYLLKPEGFTMEALERMHRIYFAEDGNSTPQKNQRLIKELNRLRNRPEADFFREMYQVKSTFGITQPVNQDRIIAFIDGELHNMDWYQDNGHHTFALAVPSYIVGYCLFNFAPPKPCRDFFYLFFRILYSTYFSALGFQPVYFDKGTGHFFPKLIKKHIQRITDQYKREFRKLQPNTNILQYDNATNFARSYLMMVRNLDLTKVD